MKIMFRNSILVLVFTVTCLSCRHKDLYMEEAMSSNLEVVFDWRDAPTAKPSSMAMYLYENDGSAPLRYIFDNANGGEIKAPFGVRHSICMNADNTEWAVLAKHENIESIEIHTIDSDILSSRSEDGTPRPDGTELERVAKTPQMLWGSRLNNISIIPHSGKQTITLYPHEAVCYYTVDIYDVENLEGLSTTQVDATLSSMAEGYNFGADSPTENQVTMPFSLSKGSSNDSLHGEFLTFGESGSFSGKHYLTVYMILTNGSKWWHSFDVTDQISKCVDPKHVHIIVRGLSLPEPPQQGGTSITPDVNEWQEINIGLQM